MPETTHGSNLSPGRRQHHFEYAFGFSPTPTLFEREANDGLPPDAPDGKLGREARGPIQSLVLPVTEELEGTEDSFPAEKG
jgi:hypothetical protein